MRSSVVVYTFLSILIKCGGVKMQFVLATIFWYRSAETADLHSLY